ncbi:hypothetical protein D3C87_1996660 [compost metagenome]
MERQACSFSRSVYAAATSMVSPSKVDSTTWISTSGDHWMIQYSAQVAASCPLGLFLAKVMPSSFSLWNNIDRFRSR